MPGAPATARTLPIPLPPRLLIAARVIHPFPTTLNAVATVVLATIANGGLPQPDVALRLALAMFCAQAAIGASNDYCDRDLDARTKPYKPIVRGAIEPRAALLLAAALALSAGALTATFGLSSVLLGALGLGAGLAYNARLKRTALSALPFMVALPALPFWVWLSIDRFTVELWWLLPFAPLAGLAVHLSNTLPDLDADRRAGVRGLAHQLGTRGSLVVAWASFAAAIALTFTLSLAIDYDWPLFLVGSTTATALFAIAVVSYIVRPGPASLQFGFGMISIGTVALAAGWLAAIS